jgi:hypothetical protein
VREDVSWARDRAWVGETTSIQNSDLILYGKGSYTGPRSGYGDQPNVVVVMKVGYEV